MFKVPAVSLNCLEIPRYHQLPLLIHNYPMDTLNKIFNALHQIAFRDTIGTVGLNVKETLKKCSHKLNIFFIPVSTSELTTSQIFFGEFFLGKKLPLGQFGSIFWPKMGKMSKTFTH